MASLSIERVLKTFGATKVLDDATLSVPSGTLMAILGASGSGKTTLLRLVAGFERADSGSIAIDGQPVAGPGLCEPPERRRIGYVAQEGALFPHLSVARNIAFGLGRGRHEARISDLLRLVGLPASYASRSPHQLSGGEQQRVALARALAPEPRLILLDEPFSALDAALRQDLRQTVAAVLRQLGTTALLVTHDQAEALSMGDQVAVLRAGRIIQSADPVTLYRCPYDADLAGFVGEAVLLEGIAHGTTADCALGTLNLADPHHGPVRLMIRPEQVRLAESGTPGGVPARIGSVQYFGHDALLEVHLADHGAPAILARTFSHALPPRHGAVSVLVDGAVGAFAAPS